MRLLLYTALAPYPVQCTHVHLRNRTLGSLCPFFRFSLFLPFFLPFLFSPFSPFFLLLTILFFSLLSLLSLSSFLLSSSSSFFLLLFPPPTPLGLGAPKFLANWDPPPVGPCAGEGRSGEQPSRWWYPGQHVVHVEACDQK